MKKVTITILAGVLLATSCKKKKDDVTPMTTAKVVTTTASKDTASGRCLNITLSYSSSDTSKYVDDLLVLYSSDTVVWAKYVYPTGSPQSVILQSSVFPKNPYKLYVVREYRNPPKDTISTITGN